MIFIRGCREREGGDREQVLIAAGYSKSMYNLLQTTVHTFT